jgi:hypothetical protein
MSATGRTAAQRLGAGAALLLLLCALGLAVHFIHEGLPAALSGPACCCESDGDPSDPVHADGEEACLTPCLAGLPVDQSDAPVPKAGVNGGASFSILPQLPPPNPSHPAGRP